MAITRHGVWGRVLSALQDVQHHGYLSAWIDARPSMEACGIDVFKTARDNGFPITVVRTHEEERNFYGVILVE